MIGPVVWLLGFENKLIHVSAKKKSSTTAALVVELLNKCSWASKYSFKKQRCPNVA
jgi:hypothetical protein